MLLSNKLSTAFMSLVAVAVLTAGLLIVNLRGVIRAKDQVIEVQVQAMIESEILSSLANRMVANGRGYLIAPEQRFLDGFHKAETEFTSHLIVLHGFKFSSQTMALLQRIDETSRDYIAGLNQAVRAKDSQASKEALAELVMARMVPLRDALDLAIANFSVQVRSEMTDARVAAAAQEQIAIVITICLSAIIIALAVALSLWLRRTLSGTLNTAVLHLQTASVEIEAGSTQQANGTREQHTAIVEVTSTINELQATSKRIMENAQRVAGIALKTESSAQQGVRIGDEGIAAMTAIRSQIDAVVAGMLDLSRRCQQIGSVVDVINELTEQTTILAINASIEAVGAGDAGNRFGAVADEIRRLAERVRTSTRDIRVHIDGVRGGANAMVLSTEEGAKTVTAGTARLAEIGKSFDAIAGLVHTALDDAREIELGTQQQTTAVEQVNSAIAEIGAAARQFETATKQIQTATADLSQLARDLRKKIF